MRYIKLKRYYFKLLGRANSMMPLYCSRKRVIRKEGDNESPEEEEASQKLCPGPEVVFHDFDSIAVLNAWTRFQRQELSWRRNWPGLLYRIISFTLEYAALVAVFIPTENMAQEHFYSVLVYLLCLVATGIVYAALINSESWKMVRFPLSRRDVYEIALSMLFIFKPFRQSRKYVFFRPQKKQILSREFIHGETVTKDQLSFITKVNLNELYDARDDLYEVFLQGIPMALLQYHYLVNVNPSTEYCFMKDIWRTMLIIIYLVASVKCSVTYEWKKRVFQYSLHVQEYLSTNGKYMVPKMDFNLGCFILMALCHLTAITARFYMISFASGIHWGLGLAALALFLVFNWFMVVVNPSTLATVQNLPYGISLPACQFVDLFINAFTAKETRFNDLSRQSFKSCFCQFRIPLVLTQIFSFLLPYIFVSSFVAIYEGKIVNSTTAASNSTFNCSSIHHSSIESSILNFFETVASVPASVLRVKFRTPDEFLKATQFHWLCFYAYVGIACLYNLYHSRFVQIDREGYPVKLSCAYFKVLFDRIQEKVQNSPDGSLHKKLVKRLLFLICVDLDEFTKIYNSFQTAHPDIQSHTESNKWWDTSISKHLEVHDSPRTRYRHTNCTTSMEGCPLESELDKVASLMQRDHLSFRLYNYCLRRLDHVLLHQVTSYRIKSTLDIFGITTREAYRHIRQNRK